MLRLHALLALTTVLSLPAFAERSARLLTDDAPLIATLTPSATSLAFGAAEQVAAALTPSPSFGVHFAKTFAVGVGASAVGVVTGNLLGGLSNNLYAALLPAALSNLFIGPVLTVLAALLIGNDGAPGRYGFWGPFAVAFGLNLVQYLVVSLFFGVAVAWSNPVAMLLYTVVDGLLMSGGSVGLMHLLEKRPAVTVLPSFVPGVSDTQFVSMTKVEF
jgi:hypothetical protein